MSLSAGLALDVLDFFVYIGATKQDKTEMRRKFSATDIGWMGGQAILTIAEGDVVSFAMDNTATANDVTIRNFNLIIKNL